MKGTLAEEVDLLLAGLRRNGLGERLARRGKQGQAPVELERICQTPVARGLSANPKFVAMKKRMEAVFDHKTFGSLMLLGPCSAGKKEILAMAARECDVESFIFIDGLIQDRPQKVTARIESFFGARRRAEAAEGQPEEPDQEAAFERFEGVVEELFRKFVFRKRTVLYIELGKTFVGSRQTLLYTLYDKAREVETTGVVVLGSENFTFFELLDKRVRSRFSSEVYFFGDNDHDLHSFLAHALDPLPPASKRHRLLLRQTILCPEFVDQAKLVFDLTASYARVLLLVRLFLHHIRVHIVKNGATATLEDHKTLLGFLWDAVAGLTESPLTAIIESMPKQQRDVLQAIQRKTRHQDFEGKVKVHEVCAELGAADHVVLATAHAFKIHAENVLSILRLFHESKLIRASKLPLSFYGSFEYLGPPDADQ